MRHDPATMRVEIDGARHYVVPALGYDPVPSITTVISGAPTRDEDWALRAWQRKMERIEPGLADVARDVAAERGERLHASTTEALVEQRWSEQPDGWEASLRPTLQQWAAIAEVVLVDAAVWHGGFFRVAGTLDFLLRIAGGLWVWDLKTSVNPRPRAQLQRGLAQLGGYIECLGWTYDVEIAGCGLLVALPDRPAQVEVFPVADAIAAWDSRVAAFTSGGQPCM
jgi:hypothetical protein